MAKCDCHVADAKARRGAGDDGVGRAVLLQLAKHLALNVKVLKDGFNDKVGLGSRIGQIGGQSDTRSHSRSPIFINRAGLKTSLEVGLDTLDCFSQNLRIAVGQGNLQASQGEHLSYAVSHRAGTDDGDIADKRHPVDFHPIYLCPLISLFKFSSWSAATTIFLSSCLTSSGNGAGR